MRRYLSTTNLGRIAIHTALPVLANRLQCRQSIVPCTSIVHVALRARRHLRQYPVRHFLRCLLEFSLDGSHKAKDHIDGQRKQRQVHNQLRPPRQDTGHVRVSFEHGEKVGERHVRYRFLLIRSLLFLMLFLSRFTSRIIPLTTAGPVTLFVIAIPPELVVQRPIPPSSLLHPSRQSVRIMTDPWNLAPSRARRKPSVHGI